ncbi:MAG TPA: VWA domain-containing protein [Anaerolineaceae bacterium]
MTFLSPSMLYLLFLLPLFVFFYILAQRRRQKYALRYANLTIIKEAMGKGPGFRRHIPAILFMIGLALGFFALSRPTATIMLASQQGTIILTIDVSGSMRADDMKPNRLEAAKEAAYAFIDKQPEWVRIGVVAFSDTSALVQAPTNDHEAVKAAIKRLVTQRGTAIGSGILTSLDAIFERPISEPIRPRGEYGIVQPTPSPSPTPMMPGEFSPAVIVLLSDGESNRGPRPLDIINEASSRGVRVFTVGVGSPEGVVLSANGRSMRVRLDEETMKRIASESSGLYFRASNAEELKNIYETLSTRLVMKQEKTELTAYITGFGVILFIIAGFLSLMWFNRLP